MSLKYVTPIIISQSINASRTMGFGIDEDGKVIDIQYFDGNLDDGNVFTPLGNMQNLHIEGVNYDAVITANPTLVSNLEQVMNALISQLKGVPGITV